MWPWLKKRYCWCKALLRRRLRRFGGPQLRSLRHLYEKAGLRVADEPVPWNAEAVLIHAQLRLPSPGAWRKSDFQLRVPGRPPLIPISLQPGQDEDFFDLFFRCAPLPALVSLYCQSLLMGGQLQVPFLSMEAFLRDLRPDEAMVLSVNLTPAATFTSEGGFRASEDYPWTPVNEEEMLVRL